MPEAVPLPYGVGITPRAVRSSQSSQDGGYGYQTERTEGCIGAVSDQEGCDSDDR